MRARLPLLLGAGLVALVAVALQMPAAGVAAAGGGDEPEAQRPPRPDVRAWMLVDASSGERLAGHAAGRRLPIASTTKLMTAYLALHDLSLDEMVKAPPYDPLPAESVLGLEEGERVSVRDLLVAAMLPSANDAAYALAEAVSGSVPRFVKRMNGAARKLGLRDTTYANPIGLDDPSNGSSARDLAALTEILRKDPRFRKIVAKPEAKLRSGAEPRTVESRNTLLLSDDSVDGVKTGHTLAAGYVLVSSAERKGVSLIAVVLGAGSEAERDAASEELLDYGFSLYSKRPLVRRGESLGTVPTTDAEQPLEVVAGRTERVAARSDQKADVELRSPRDLGGPIAAGERVGTGVVTVDGRRAGAVPLLAAAELAGPGLLEEAGKPLATLLIAGGSILLLTAFVIAMLRRRDGVTEAVAGRTPEDRMRESRRRRRQRRQEGERG